MKNITYPITVNISQTGSCVDERKDDANGSRKITMCLACSPSKKGKQDIAKQQQKAQVIIDNFKIKTGKSHIKNEFLGRVEERTT